LQAAQRYIRHAFGKLIRTSAVIHFSINRKADNGSRTGMFLARLLLHTAVFRWFFNIWLVCSALELPFTARCATESSMTPTFLVCLGQSQTH
jgi:hypothetical protein